jgi:hypothetical protein
VKADALLYASEGRHSPEIATLQRIDRFGLEAILGHKHFYHAEYNRLMCAETIVWAYRSRAKVENWAMWQKENPRAAKLLYEAESLCPTL